jgi:hypothetical protein
VIRRVVLATSASMLGIATVGCAGGHGFTTVVDLSEDGRAKVRERGDMVSVDVHSGSGIGSAELHFARPPRAVRFIFYLQGLEQLRVEYPGAEIQLHLGSDGIPRQTGHRTGDPERTLRPGDDLWMPVRVSRAPHGRSPVTGGFESIEVETPPGFTSAAPLRCRIGWIDFYR